MIVAEQKNIKEIIDILGDDFNNLLIVGCGTCVTVSLAGGEREVKSLASILRTYYANHDQDVTINTTTVKRQCDFEFIDDIEEMIKENDIILSLACGIGVQHVVERYPEKIVYPGLNTSFYGATTAVGQWDEMCIGCGDCILDEYFAICPIARCSKQLLNGPCGGSQNGECEVDPDIDCAWELIYNRAEKLDKVEELLGYKKPKDWEVYRDGGPRKLINEEYHEDRKET
ncbi:MAG: methylenetetrahydrofolate reductase C-terminal domain-containing protein [Halanaerobiales bacterium]|nr:methylenetetrahydrofolate reductase C-terminal domain-containing protein [Halanaerobiales bacterium]